MYSLILCLNIQKVNIMNITMQRRAEIALRSLSKPEKGQLERALNQLKTLSPIEFYQISEMHKLISGSGRKLYALKGSQNLSMILSINPDNAEACTLEDIFEYDDLNQLPISNQPHENITASHV